MTAKTGTINNSVVHILEDFTNVDLDFRRRDEFTQHYVLWTLNHVTMIDLESCSINHFKNGRYDNEDGLTCKYNIVTRKRKQS